MPSLSWTWLCSLLFAFAMCTSLWLTWTTSINRTMACMVGVLWLVHHSDPHVHNTPTSSTRRRQSYTWAWWSVLRTNGKDDARVQPASDAQWVYEHTTFNPKSSISRPVFGAGGAKYQPPDVYDRLDKRLEIMQIMCKYGAHRALRYGDGNYEITEVQKHLTEVPEAAAKEVERVQREEPKFSKEDGKLGKPGTCREMSPELKHCASMISKEDPQKLEAASPECLSPLLDAIATIEVDLGINSADQSTNIDPPKSDYRLPGHWTHESKRQGTHTSEWIGCYVSKVIGSYQTTVVDTPDEQTVLTDLAPYDIMAAGGAR
ncbi:hypothetical protein AUP68_11383 [Ilyonectria robusta]